MVSAATRACRSLPTACLGVCCVKVQTNRARPRRKFMMRELAGRSALRPGCHKCWPPHGRRHTLLRLSLLHWDRALCTSASAAAAAPFLFAATNACQAERCDEQKWMPFLAAPYQQDDHSTPQRSPSSVAAWHGPRWDSGIARARLPFLSTNCKDLSTICRQKDSGFTSLQGGTREEYFEF
jgi:hypothetical protein